MVDRVVHEWFEAPGHFRMRTEADDTSATVLPPGDGCGSLHDSLGRSVFRDFRFEGRYDFIVVDVRSVAGSQQRPLTVEYRQLLLLRPQE